jgi:hypothetical protein
MFHPPIGDVVDDFQPQACPDCQGVATRRCLLIGDGQQSIYPDGYTLAEAAVAALTGLLAPEVTAWPQPARTR